MNIIFLGGIKHRQKMVIPDDLYAVEVYCPQKPCGIYEDIDLIRNQIYKDTGLKMNGYNIFCPENFDPYKTKTYQRYIKKQRFLLWARGRI